MGEDVRLALGLVFLGFSVFTVMMILGPPKGWYCKDRKPHEWTNWQVLVDGEQQRECSRCGWVEVAKVPGGE